VYTFFSLLSQYLNGSLLKFFNSLISVLLPKYIFIYKYREWWVRHFIDLFDVKRRRVLAINLVPFFISYFFILHALKDSIIKQQHERTFNKSNLIRIFHNILIVSLSAEPKMNHPFSLFIFSLLCNIPIGIYVMIKTKMAMISRLI